MISKKILSFLFDSIYFVFTAASCLFIFFWVSDKLAVNTSSPNIYGGLAVIAMLVPIYLVYAAISKKLEHR